MANLRPKDVRIIHQLDAYRNKIVGEYWVLDGVSFHDGQPLKKMGFTWISGPDGGSWEAPNRDALRYLLEGGCPVHNVGNGHEIGYPDPADFDHLIGSRYQLEYKPSHKSRKWRQAWSGGAYTPNAFNDAVTLARQDNLYTFRFVRNNP